MNASNAELLQKIDAAAPEEFNDLSEGKRKDAPLSCDRNSKSKKRRIDDAVSVPVESPSSASKKRRIDDAVSALVESPSAAADHTVAKNDGINDDGTSHNAEPPQKKRKTVSCTNVRAPSSRADQESLRFLKEVHEACLTKPNEDHSNIFGQYHETMPKFSVTMKVPRSLTAHKPKVSIASTTSTSAPSEEPTKKSRCASNPSTSSGGLGNGPTTTQKSGTNETRASNATADDDGDEKKKADHEEPSKGWGNCFQNQIFSQAGSWKCDACSVSNKATVNKCAACEKVRPGQESKKEADGPANKGQRNVEGGGSDASATTASIGAGGFTFGTSTTGFTFGTSAGGDNGGAKI